MQQIIFIAVSSALAFLSPFVYARAILKGQAKPHRTTRFVLLVITCLSTASLLAKNDQVAVWLAGVSAFQSVLIFILSIKHGMGGWSRGDIVCLLIAILGIVGWQTTNEPLIGLYFSIAADFTGMIPAIIKTYRFPKTEIASFFLLDVFAGFFSLLAVKSFTIQQFSYPLYIMLINFVMVILILRPRKK
jgi:hypothetical protein